jgi:methylase of polypeptide subunit release factors
LLEGSLHKDLDPKKFDPVTVDGKEGRPEPLKILDLCSGSGCISLLLYSLLSKRISNIQVRGYDISEMAHKLSIENLRDAEKNHFHKPSPVEFRLRDIYDDADGLQIDPQSKTVDIIISNPPYIGETAFNKSTSRSVRNFEPRLALVPSRLGEPGHGRFFYWRLLQLHKQFRSRVLVMEVSGVRQAAMVSRLARLLCGSNNTIELWRDWPDQDTSRDKKSVKIDGKWTFPVKGAGSYRAIVLRRHPSKTADGLEDIASQVPETQ